jgi:hypothetical protein
MNPQLLDEPEKKMDWWMLRPPAEYPLISCDGFSEEQEAGKTLDRDRVIEAKVAMESYAGW